MNDLQELLNYFVVNPEEVDINFKLGNYYNSIGQTASAISYYIRTSERTNDKEQAYSCLLAAANCFDLQGCRSNSVKGMLQNAISLLPSRPEAYFLLSRFYERQSNYQDSYLIASIGESVSDRECRPLDINVGYPGFYGIIFEKAVSAWHCGLCDESCNLHYDLLEKYEMDSIHTGTVSYNIDNLFAGRREVVESVKTVEEDNRLSYESKPTVWVVDNFYEEPDSMREFALNQNYDIGGIGRGYIGNRTHEQFLFPELKSKFENIMGKKITKWEFIK